MSLDFSFLSFFNTLIFVQLFDLKREKRRKVEHFKRKEKVGDFYWKNWLKLEKSNSETICVIRFVSLAMFLFNIASR